VLARDLDEQAQYPVKENAMKLSFVEGIALFLVSAVLLGAIGRPIHEARTSSSRPVSVIVVPLPTCPESCICELASATRHFELKSECLDIDYDGTTFDETTGCCDLAEDCFDKDCSFTSGKIRFRVICDCYPANIEWNSLGNFGSELNFGGWSSWIGPDTASGACGSGEFGLVEFYIACANGDVILDQDGGKACGRCLLAGVGEEK
jgi:hypothetical protein